MRFFTVTMRLWEWICLIVCVGLFLAQLALASPQKSAVVDEQYHLAAGYAFLKTGEFPLLTGHPPLMNALAALPLLWRDDVHLPLDHPSWAEGNYFIFGDVFMWQANPTSTDFLLWARWPIMAVGAVLVIAIFGWARQLGGRWAGWLALGLAIFDPNLLTHSRLVTTDLGLTCFVFLTLWQLWRLLEKERHNPEQANWANWVVVGLLAGLTMTAKFTGILIWPIIAIILWLTPRRHSQFFSQRLQQLFIMGLCAYAAIWAVYGFDFGPIPGSRFPLPVPAPLYPRDAWNLFMVIEQEPVPAFLLGRTSPRGWWFYFPVALLVKTPLPLLLLAAAGLAALWKQTGWRKTAVFLIPPTVFMLLAITGRFTIGYRHILAVVPFLVLIASQSSRWINGRFGTVQIRPKPYPATALLIIGLLGWQVVGTARLWPHQEAFFNELARGPVGGGRVLADSNIDWGQDLPALRRLMDEKGIEQVYLGYYGTAVPERYGVRYRPIPGFLRFTGGAEIEAFNPYTPPPGWYAISLTSLRLGLFYQNRHLYRYFWNKEPVAQAGYSINLYHVQYPPNIPIDRRVVIGRSVSDIPPHDFHAHPGHRLILKWAQSPETIIAPAGSHEAAAILSQLQTACTQPGGYCLSADFAGAFTLLGATMTSNTVKPGEAVDLQLYWQVETAEIATPFPAFAAPLAAFVHLSGQEPGQIVSQYDGWGTALTGLEAGDLIVQHVVLPVPVSTPSGNYALRLGLYSPQTGQRLAIVGETADFVTLETAVRITE